MIYYFENESSNRISEIDEKKSFKHFDNEFKILKKKMKHFAKLLTNILIIAKIK